MEKCIELTLENGNIIVLYSDDDLYNTYNDWIIDMDTEKDFKNEDYSTVEEIREWHTEVWEGIPSGKYTLKEFEQKALEIL